VIPVIIIGAGISGLILSRALNAPILEKSKGVGGRLATRRIENEKFDHGLPYWPLNENTLPIYASPSHPQGMTAIAKGLAADLVIHKDTKVEKIERLAHGWRLVCGEQSFEAARVVLTAPVPQALELLEKSDLSVEEAWRVPYHKALIGIFRLAGLDAQSKKWSGHQLILQADKSLCPDGAVLIASPEFSERYFDQDEDIVLEKLTQLLKEAYPTAVIGFSELKKWRYSTPMCSLGRAYLEAAPGLYLAGDGFITPDVSGAIASAKTLLREQFQVL
jgi:hypothetical protein